MSVFVCSMTFKKLVLLLQKLTEKLRKVVVEATMSGERRDPKRRLLWYDPQNALNKHQFTQQLAAFHLAPSFLRPVT